MENNNNKLEALVAEIKRKKAEAEAEQQAKVQAIFDGVKAKKAAEEKKRKEKTEAAVKERQRKLDAKLDAELRSLFFSANPGASEDDFEAVKPELRKQEMLRRAEETRKIVANHPSFRW